MSHTLRVLVADERDTLVARSLLAGVKCPCGRPAVRVTLDLSPPLKRGRHSGIGRPDAASWPLRISAWCGEDDDLHMGVAADRWSGDMLDPETCAMTEDDLT